MSLKYDLNTNKYGEKLYSNFVIMNMKKAINYEFTLDDEQNVISIFNIENKNVLPKTLMEVIYSFMINEILIEFKNKHKMNDKEFIQLSSLVYEDNEIRGNQYFLLVEINEWLKNSSYYNLDNLIDFKLRKFKVFLQKIIGQIFEEEKINQELLEKVKELEDYTTKVFKEKFGLEQFELLTIKYDENQKIYFESTEGLKINLDFIQETLGLLIRFNDENDVKHEKSEVVAAAKLLQLLIASLGVHTLDITSIENEPFELTIICNVFYSVCTSLNRKPTLINQNINNDKIHEDKEDENDDGEKE